MEKLVLNYIGVDDWSRPVYKDESGQLFKDVNCGDGQPALCTVYGGMEGEPDTPIENIEKYKGVEIELVGREGEPTSEEKFRYQLLSRLQMDCDYFLGNGNRNDKYLWALNVPDQISKMKELHNSFSEDMKPEWLTFAEILNYESKMSK